MKTIMAIMVLFAAGPALAQKQGPAEPPREKVNQVLVYGEQPCPKAEGDEIVVCVRSPDEPYRLPKALRDDPSAPENQSWANKVKAVEYVGRSGIQSCSPVGAGGFTGCLNQIVKQAYAEKAADSTWTTLVAAERAKRLGKIDAESEAVEAQAKLDEAAAKAQPANGGPPPR